MFESFSLNEHLATSDSIKTNSIIFSEWNLNDPQNIKRLGNYRYRPTDSSSPYYLIPLNYTDIEIGPTFYYTGATDSDTVIDSGLNDEDEPTVFLSPQKKMKMLFSLEECIKPFRPRSGINKLLYLGSIGSSAQSSQFIDDGRAEAARRPRYYMASRDDQFKYWTSFRKDYSIPTPIPGNPPSTEPTENIRGVSFYDSVRDAFYIEDCAPFVVYENTVPTNKIVVKMQTNVGEVSLGNFRYNDNETIGDPLFGDANKTTPVRWRIEALKNLSWEPLVSFDENSLRSNGQPIIGPDGYLEISYGLKTPQQFVDTFTFIGELTNSTLLPDTALTGYAYLIREQEEDLGILYVFNEGTWEQLTPEYGWEFSEEELTVKSKFATKLSDPYYFVSGGQKVYREMDFIDGIRLVVETMNKDNCTFDLIEFSPRLFANITELVGQFSITKTMSDLGNSSLPLGGLYASTGTIEIFDTDFSFNENNVFDKITGKGSVVSQYLNNNIKFVFYRMIKDVEGFDYYVPTKTMYANGFPQALSPESTLNLQLRDFFFYLESSKAPQFLLTNISLSYIVMILLDSIGFDNYVFNRLTSEEIVIPYFFVEPGQNVAEVLQKLAIASQSAMFFDEYNNFVVMSKEYVLPDTESDRTTNMSLLGQEQVYATNGENYKFLGNIYSLDDLPNFKEFGAYLNLSNDLVYVWSEESDTWEPAGSLEKISKPNIVSFSTKDKIVYNAGQINYTTRYLQRSIGSTTAALKLDEYKNYVYKPSLLWEAQGGENRQTINEVAGRSSGYVLGAVPLNSDLNDSEPYSINNVIYNNIIDVGENVYWMVNYQGYLYANGEIIKYDAIEYIVSGTSSSVWISSNRQYQNYFSKMPFNGKMYPTGRVRIYTQPEFEYVDSQLRIKDSNPIKINGRAQFGSQITYHSAGVNADSHWKNSSNIYGCIQDSSSYLFNTSQYINYPDSLTDSASGKEKTIGSTYIGADSLARNSLVSGIIKNFLTDKQFTESELSYKKTTEPGSIQSSALVVTGPAIPSVLPPNNFVSYIYKDFMNPDGSSTPFKHYGTRMRIIGNIESGTNKSQSPIGRFPIFTGSSPSSNSSLYAAPSITTSNNSQEIEIFGGSGGIAFNIDKQKNTGYYFEIAALTVDNIDSYNNQNNPTVVSANLLSDPAPSASGNTVTVWTENEVSFQVGQTVIISGLVDTNDPTNTNTPLNGEYKITAINANKKQFQYEMATTLNTTSQTGGRASIDIGSETNIANVFFYKIVSDEEGNSVPYKLWSGLTKINVDSGEFYGQSRLIGEDNTTVYDLAAEYINVGSSRRFYLYINNKQVAVVDDDKPLNEKNSLALFVRGSSKCMFDNVYALANNYSQNTLFPVQNGIAQVFGDSEIDATEAFRKYALSGIIQKTFLSGISSLEEPRYQIFFDEFGTILREAAYFNVLYDRAYPALYAKLMKTTNNLKGYSTSGFYAWSYGAEFLIFNCTDFAITLDDTSGNYLRILGAAFTQSTSYTLTVDELFKKRENLIDSALGRESILFNPLSISQEYNAIKNSRDKYGTNEITVESPYIQTDDAAEDIFNWIINKTSKPRRMIGVELFATETMQLGDIVDVKYQNEDGLGIISEPDKRFVVYQIENSFSGEDTTTVAYLAEV